MRVLRTRWRVQPRPGGSMIQPMRDRLKVYLFLSAVLLLALVGMFSYPAYSQVLYGSLVGTVTDQSGAVVPGATVSITDIQTGQTRGETSDSGGRYSIVNITPGT